MEEYGQEREKPWCRDKDQCKMREREREKKIIQMKQRMQENFRKNIQDDCTTCQHMGICERIDLTTNIHLEFTSKR